MRTVAIITARMGSSRLPGKVLSDLSGLPVLEWVYEAAKAAPGVDKVWVATSTESADNAIEVWCEKRWVRCYRGSEDDVLRRFAGAALQAEADIVIRLTGDCPFLDPNVIGEVVRLRQTLNVDYASNIYPPTWPDGLDCEVFTAASLFIADNEATSKIDRECVTTFITNNHHRFSTANLTCPIPGLHKSRWVLDTEDDQKFMRKVALHIGTPASYLEILGFLDKNPELMEINHHHPRNERLYEALATEPLPRRSYNTSKKLLKRAEKTIPLGAQTYSKSKIQYPSDSPLFITHGMGGYCYDVDGNRYVDLVGGLLPNILGHADPDVNEAIRRQLDKGISFSLATELEAELSELLCRLIPCAEMARFGKNGTDATSAAVRLARAYTGRDTIVSSGYHGWNDWSVARDPVRNNGVPLEVRECTVPLGHGNSTALGNLMYRHDIAAVIVEPETDPEFLQFCRYFCRQTGALLIFDEIITGLRFDLGGAQKLYGITPDLACFGKSMGNGMPISALVGKREIMEHMTKTSFSGTFFGEALSLAASIATIKKLEQEDVLHHIQIKQETLRCSLTKPLLETNINLGGTSWLPRLDFPSQDIKTLFIQEMAQNGVLIIASHNLCYAHGKNEIDRVVTAYGKTLKTIQEAVEADTVKELIGEAISPQANVRLA